jgi:hypothetical protein
VRYAAALLVATAGCATAAEEAPVRGGGGSCESSKAQALVGRTRSQAVEAEALRLTGARAVRWIPEGAMVTMDYREDRLNLHLDGKGAVVKIACG